MRNLARESSRELGLPPGTPVYVGRERQGPVRLTLIDYDADQIEERELEDVDGCASLKDTPTVTWINVDGLQDVDCLQRLGDCFGLHPLLLEDVANTRQRPKLEEYPGYLYVVLKMFTAHDGEQLPTAEQLSLVLGPGFVISFQERAGDVFEGIRDRIRNGKGRIRQMGADYLLYALIDAIVDGYFVTCEELGEQIEEIESDLLHEPESSSVGRVHRLKRQVIFLRRSIWPLREVISGLMRGESPLISETTNVYLRDVYDHTIQVMDTVESARDVLGGLLDLYLSSLSNRMNEVMKVLTIIATIFIPLTFIAGIYGMNFEYMPELGWKWGYPVVLFIMAAIAVGMLVYFRRKEWL